MPLHGKISRIEKQKRSALQGTCKNSPTKNKIRNWWYIIDLYLDEDEAGDMTDPRNGYDIKIIRSGSGKLDTTYSARACKPTKLDKKYQGNVDLEGIVRSQIKSYDELEELLAKFLNEDHGGDDDEDDKPKKKAKKKGIHRDHYMEDDEPKKKKKKRYKSDI